MDQAAVIRPDGLGREIIQSADAVPSIRTQPVPPDARFGRALSEDGLATDGLGGQVEAEGQDNDRGNERCMPANTPESRTRRQTI